MRTTVVLSILLAVTFASGDEPPDPQTRRAAELYDSASTHYRLAEFEPALKDFQEGYRLRPDPAFLFNIGQCQRQLGDFEGAVHSFGSYLREMPDAPNAPEVRHLVASLQTRIQPRPPKSDPPSRREPTEETPPPPVAAPAAAAISLPSPAGPIEPPRKRRRWIWGVVVGSVAAAGIAVALGVGLTQTQAPNTTLGTRPIFFQ